MYPTKPAGERRETFSCPNAADVRQVQRMEREVSGEDRRYGREAEGRWKNRYFRKCDGRAFRGNKGGDRRLHDRLGGKHGRGDRGGSSEPGSMDARVKCRGQRDQHFLTTPKLVEDFFRHEYGRLLATTPDRCFGRTGLNDHVRESLPRAEGPGGAAAETTPAPAAAWAGCVAARG